MTNPAPADDITLHREALVGLIAQHLSGTYHCLRVWEAWQIGTMSQDDFEDVVESDTPGEIADAILALAAPPVPAAVDVGAAQAETALAGSAADVPQVEASILQLVEALIHSKGWMRGYADAVVRDAIDRTDQAETAQTAAADVQALQNALKLALEYWGHRQQRYKNRHPAWVQAAHAALATPGATQTAEGSK